MTIALVVIFATCGITGAVLDLSLQMTLITGIVQNVTKTKYDMKYVINCSTNCTLGQQVETSINIIV